MMTENSLQLARALAAEEDKLLACIHCGLCLEACPTYVHTGDENDSPRGRLYLMRAVKEGRLGATSWTFTRHIDRCLGCRACESACPAGVEYGHLLEAARSDIMAHREPKSLPGRLLRLALQHLWPHPARLRFALGLARLVRDAGVPRLLLRTKAARLVAPRLEFALALLDSSAPAPIREERQERGAAADSAVDNFNARPPHPAAYRALLFTGCVTEGLFARVNRATARVLETNDCAVSAPSEQACCGALHAHAGELEGALALARRNIDAFAGDESGPIITNAGGCGAMLVSYGQLLAGDKDYAARARVFSARVRDVGQQLQTTGVRRGARLGSTRVTYDASCHLLHGQRASNASLGMLQAAVPELHFVPLMESDVCCGGAGVYNLVEPELSARVLAEKLAHIKQTGAEVLATGNPGCHMQISAGARLSGISIRVCHPVELVDESYRRAGFYDGDESEKA